MCDKAVRQRLFTVERIRRGSTQILEVLDAVTRVGNPESGTNLSMILDHIYHYIHPKAEKLVTSPFNASSEPVIFVGRRKYHEYAERPPISGFAISFRVVAGQTEKHSSHHYLSYCCPWLWVNPDERRQGLGTSLFAAVMMASKFDLLNANADAGQSTYHAVFTSTERSIPEMGMTARSYARQSSTTELGRSERYEIIEDSDPFFYDKYFVEVIEKLSFFEND